MSPWKKLRGWLRGLRKLARVSRQRPPRLPRTRLAIEYLEDRLVPSASSDFRGIIGLPAVQAAYPYKGDGYSVALLDTGVNYNLSDLGGGFGAGHRVVAGWDFVNNDADPMDDNGHGTFVAGEIASSNAAFPGIAPDVNIIALKVLDSQKNGSWANMDAALQWVIAHRTQYNIVAVNMSLGSGNYTSDPFNLLESDIATLKSAGVFTAVASGNNFATVNSTAGLQYPAVDPDVVSVGATWAGSYGSVTYNGATDPNTAPNQLADFSQRDSALSILAPGAWLTSDAMGGGTTQYGGTSMAAAVVTGASVLLRQAIDTQGLAQDANQGYILGLMQSTGVAIVDNNAGTSVKPTGLTFRQLDLKAALDAVPQRPTFATIPTQTISPGGKVVIPLSVTDPRSVTFSAQVICPAALAWQVDQQLGLSTTGNYRLNEGGQNEKWLIDKNLQWYWLMPNGDLRRYTGNAATTLSPANLVATFDPTYYADPRRLWYPTYVPWPPISLSIAGNLLTVQSTSASWTGQAIVSVTASDGTFTMPQTFTVNVGAVVAGPPVIGALPNLTVLHSQRAVNVGLSASDPAGRAVMFSARVLPAGGQTPPITVALQGTQLTLTAAASFVGSYTVQVTASDGLASATASFSVTVTNTAPNLATIATQSILLSQSSVTVPLSATDAEGDPLTYSARVLTPDAQAYQIEQQYALHQYNGSYYTNLWGYNEKWLQGAGGQWYNLLPDGRLYRWAGTMTQTIQPANLIATLAPIFWTEPRLLWQAQPPVAPAITVSVQGNQITFGRQAGMVGVYMVEAAVTDGAATSTRTFLLVLN